MSEIATLEPQPAEPEQLTPEQVEANSAFIAAEFGKHGTKGKGSRVPAAQKQLIYALIDHGKLSPSQVSDRLGMDIRTVNGVLRLRDELGVSVTNLFKVNALDVGKNWMTACKKGAAKGRHEPSRDLLAAIGVIQMPSQAQAHQSVTVILSGGEMPSELRVGVQQVTPAFAP